MLVSDPAFAGSDTLATARPWRWCSSEGSFDLVLAGRNSVDADTGRQVGPELAQLLDLACVTGVRELSLVEGRWSCGSSTTTNGSRPRSRLPPC